MPGSRLIYKLNDVYLQQLLSVPVINMLRVPASKRLKVGFAARIRHAPQDRMKALNGR
jgi:hypothetical protein